MAASRRANKRRKKRGKHAPKGPRTFTFSPGPDLLHALGPLVLAQWSVTAAYAHELTNAGQPVPDPITGMLILDTGATSTCIDEDVANALGLPPVRIGKTTGVHGEQSCNVYSARMRIAIRDRKGNVNEYFREGETVGAVGIQELGRRQNLRLNDKPIPLIGLLGRDVLRSTKFIYDGVNGTYRVTFR